MRMTETRKTTNFYWFEYLEKISEEVYIIENEIKQKQTMLQWLESEESCTAETIDLLFRAKSLLESCTRFRKNILLDLDQKIHETIPPQKYFEIRGELYNINMGLTFLTVAIDNRFEGSMLPEFSFYMPFETLSGFEKICNAANFVFRELFGLVFGEERLRSTKEPHPLVIFYQDDYYVNSNLRVANIPVVDKYRYRFWVGLAHETMHSAIPDFRDIEKAAEGDAEALTKVQKTSKRLGIDECKLFLSLIENMKNVLLAVNGFYDLTIEGKKARLKVKHAVEDKEHHSRKLVEYFIENQIQEILCDFASILLAGPAVVFNIATSCVDSYKNIPWGVDKFSSDIAHLSDYARIKCMFALLRHQTLGYPKDITFKWETRIEKLVGFDAIDTSYLTSLIFQVGHVTNFFDRIIEVLKLLIFHEDFYTWNRWMEAKRIFDQLNINGKLSATASGVDLLNIAWMKRDEAFERMVECEDIQLFKEWHFRERKLFEEAICFLSDKYRELLERT
jgi:hypothetical protein